MLTEKQAVIYWQQLQLSRAEFTFSCGGDQMNETNLILYDKDEKVIKEKLLEDYFNRNVYDSVEFYVNSSDNYLGEYGIVTILLEEDEFDYSKSTTEEWEETLKKFKTIRIPKKFIDYFDNIVSFYISDSDQGFDYYDDSKQSDEVEEEIVDFLVKRSKQILTDDEKRHEFTDWYYIESKNINPKSMPVEFTYSYYGEREMC